MRTMWVVVAAAGCVVGGGEQAFEFDDIAGLRVELGSGDVRAWGGSPDGVTRVHTDGGGIGRDNVSPDVRFDADGWVTVDMNGGPLGGGDLDVEVPDGLPLEVDVDLQAPADLWACVAAGDIAVTLPAGRYALDLDGGAGSIEVDRRISDDPMADHRVSLCVAAGGIDVGVHGEW